MAGTRMMGLLLVLLLLGCPFTRATPPGGEDEANSFDVVLCIDLSGSTNGLIDNVREHIWSMVNLATTMQPAQHFRIGVVAFSRPSFGKNNFYVKVMSRLTDDFEALEDELYKLKPAIEKGDQFVSNALATAHWQMNWSKAPGSVKIIFLIGNGSVQTGTSDYRNLVESISESGVELVPVYCLRSRTTPDQEGWSHIGRISGHEYETILVQKRDPFLKQHPDQEKIKKLNRQFNQTLVPFDNTGLEALRQLKVCDNKTLLNHPVIFEDRLIYKVSAQNLSRIARWDLVSNRPETVEELAKLDLSLLADSLRFKPLPELLGILNKLHADRKLVLSEIKKLLPDDRQKYINRVLTDNTFEKERLLDRVLLLNLIRIASKYQIRVV